jgi:formylglycine-generating enzyme required for sulfatase activity
VRGVEFGPGPYGSFMRRAGLTAEQIVGAVGYEPYVSPVLAIATDSWGRLWVTRSTDGIAPELVDVLSTSGEYRGTLRATGMPVAFLSDAVFVSLRLDELGRTVVSLYELRSSGAAAAGGGNPAGFREFRDCPQCPELVELPPGRFVMGSPDGEDEAARRGTRAEWTIRAEKPQVEVEIAYPFAIGKYEVTFAEWDHCVEAGGCSYSPADNGWGRGDRPVIYISRPDAEEYLRWLSSHTGQRYRLPSEAEWEYAARGGTTTARYWGDDVGRNMTVCDGCGSRWDNRSTAPVGSFPPNPFGLHDMLGNVSEWTADCWTPSHTGAPADGSVRTGDPDRVWADGECSFPVRRGGAWGHFRWSIRAATRIPFEPGPWSDRSESSGFRVVRELAAEVST